jgi:hypothetical protein
MEMWRDISWEMGPVERLLRPKVKTGILGLITETPDGVEKDCQFGFAGLRIGRLVRLGPRAETGQLVPITESGCLAEDRVFRTNAGNFSAVNISLRCCIMAKVSIY